MTRPGVKNTVVILAALLVLAAAVLLPVPPGLTIEGKNTIGLAAFFLVLLIGRPLPLPVICLLTIASMPLVSVTASLGGALSGFSSPVLYFTVASFCLSAAFTSVPLSNRLIRFLLTRFAKSTGSMLLSLMICGALVSSIISNIPNIMLFIAVGNGILSVINNEGQKKSIGKALFIAVTFSSMIGGMITPAGSSLNILAIGLLQEATGITVTFTQWMFAGTPVAIILLLAAWFVIMRIYKPEQLSREDIEACVRALPSSGRFKANEIFVSVIFAVTVTLWIISSWFPAIDITIVAIISACICFIPALNILSKQSFGSIAQWDVFFIQGTALTLGASMITNSVDKFFSDIFFSALPQLPLTLTVAACALFVFLMLLLIPIAPAMVAVFAAQFAAFAALQGVPPAILTMVLAVCASNCYLLPLDSVPLLGLQTGYFTIPDMAKSAAVMQIIVIIILSLWFPVVSRIVF